MRIELAHPLTLWEIATATNGRVTFPYTNSAVYYIATDSREVIKGDLFIALDGKKFNGEDFVSEAVAKGAHHFSTGNSHSGIQVDDTKEGLLKLAKYYKKKFKNLKHTVCITGSVGKTTTKEFTKVLLSEKYSVHATPENKNNTLGVPLTILSMPKDCEALVIEMGMNSFGEISKSSICASPDISIILNVGTSHIGLLGSRKNIAEAKLEIKQGMSNGRLILPYGEPLFEKEDAMTFDCHSTDADFYFKKTLGLCFYHNRSLIASLNFKFKEAHLQECLLAATVCSYLSGVRPEELSRGASKISEENIRQKIVNIDNFCFLTDFYNSSYESVIAALNSLSTLSSYQRKSVLLGDILELGEKSDEIHTLIGKNIAKYNIFNLYLFGKCSKNILAGAKSEGFPESRIFLNEDIENPDLTAAQIKTNHTQGEIILMKASRGIRLERILSKFEKQE